jgi:hypothetical protein
MMTKLPFATVRGMIKQKRLPFEIVATFTVGGYMCPSDLIIVSISPITNLFTKWLCLLHLASDAVCGDSGRTRWWCAKPQPRLQTPRPSRSRR